MAPRSEHAIAEIISSHVTSNDESSILVEAGGFTPMRYFLEHVAPSDLDDMEPPSKRRKTHSPDRLEHVDHDIPLFDLAIDLNISDSSTTTFASVQQYVDFSSSAAVAVVPLAIKTDEAGTVIKLGLPNGKGPVLTVDCLYIPPSALELLQVIASPKHLATAKALKWGHPATRRTCELVRSIGPLTHVVRLRASLSWCSGVSAFPLGVPNSAKFCPDYDVLLTAFPDQDRASVNLTDPFNPQDFYESVYAPSKQISVEGLYENVLECELYPFQKRAVSWLLQREGVSSSIDTSTRGAHDIFYKPVKDLNGRTCWANHLQGLITHRITDVDDSGLSGGILAEEMGLGKTVELMALIMLHKRTPSSHNSLLHDIVSNTRVKPSQATLIVTPASLTQQWKSELARHAPALRVLHYQGIPTGQSPKEINADLIQSLCQDYDIVLTTYTTLSKEIHFVEEPPNRNMRHARKFERKKSPLVQVQWWRVCLDEAQLVESGVTQAARVARKLPRVHSWAVSGTPLRKDVQDLLGLLTFLRYKPFHHEGPLWSHLLTNHRHLFKQIFGQIALRHNKVQIRDELRLPPQKRVVVTMPFSIVEQQNYTTLFNAMCADLGVDSNGAPNVEDWDPKALGMVESMRSWLVRLRQTCLHPEVGGRNRIALGRGARPLRTVAEVLEVMIEQNETSLRAEERALIAISLHRGHIVGNNRKDKHRSQKAVEIYEPAMRSSKQLVQEARARLAAAAGTGAVLDTDRDEDSSAESNPLIGRLRNNLRPALQLYHQCLFFTATAYYQIKTNEALTEKGSEAFKELEAKEATLYEDAKLTRKEILEQTHRKAESLMRQVKEVQKRGTHLPKIKDLTSLGGIESQRIVEKSDDLFDVIREQVEVMQGWRAKMSEYLLKPLVDEDDGLETTGDEYEKSTKLQDELYVYFDVFKAIQADLNTFITGENAPLIDHEAKEMLKNARWLLRPDISEFQKHWEGVHAPHLAVELYSIRDKFRKRKDEIGSVRGLIQEARSLETSMQYDAGIRASSEQNIVQRHIAQLHNMYTAYTKGLKELEKDVELFRVTQNQRVEFYRQLQELSDAVTPYREKLDKELDHRALEVAMDREEQVGQKLAQLQTRNRFLLHLRDDKSLQIGSKTCVICGQPFERGVLTVCGHSYCRECLSEWFKQRRACPVCKRGLSNDDLHDITLQPREIHAHEEATHSGEASPSPTKAGASSTIPSSLYTDADSKLMDDINAIDLPTSYGTKIDTLGRHLHWIREHDPGAKSILFSQFRDFLDVLGTALDTFKIGHARFGCRGAVDQFRHDPSIDCLLLDAKTDSSGLTLVNATHVFICEPLIQTAVELQAIARVHRIGQTRPTTVWMYLIQDTVEEAIYDISVARRLAHVRSREQQQQDQRDQHDHEQLPETALDAANSDQLQSAPLKQLLSGGHAGGELVQNHDLWQCLFGKPQATATVLAEQHRAVGVHLRATAAEGRRLDDGGGG
jgi:E3 ubiquitin-protein ligase SHPRH